MRRRDGSTQYSRSAVATLLHSTSRLHEDRYPFSASGCREPAEIHPWAQTCGQTRLQEMAPQFGNELKGFIDGEN